ncbi:MAG: hypothetical protein EBR09_05380 [Proteobacteria bacterium]|nr:hypothetical protein [Pseudomonadota bacterium]
MFQKFQILSSFLVVGVAFSACGTSTQPIESKPVSIVGKDNRKVEKDRELLSRIGSLDHNGKAICTVFASGPDEVTTAGHCFSDSPVAGQYTVTIENQKHAVQSVQKSKKADIAKLTVSGIADYFESAEAEENFDTSVTAFSIEHNKILSARGEKLTVENSSSLLNYRNDTIKGSSGAPVLQNNKVVGVHLGSRVKDSEEVNFGVSFRNAQSADVTRTPYSPECHSLNPFCGGGALDFGQSTIAVCGVNMSIPTVAYAICAANVYLLPAGCTVGTAVSAGGICLANVTLVSAACGVSVAKIAEIAKKCTE